MPKRIVIVICGILLTGGLAYVLVDWGPNTIEYHTKGYFEERYWNGFERWIEKRGPGFAVKLVFEWQAKRMRHHLESLVRLGFVQHCTIAVSNASPNQVILKAVMDHSEPPPEVFEWFTFNGEPKVIHLYTKPEGAELWTNLIRKADVPAANFARRTHVSETP